MIALHGETDDEAGRQRERHHAKARRSLLGAALERPSDSSDKSADKPADQATDKPADAPADKDATAQAPSILTSTSHAMMMIFLYLLLMMVLEWMKRLLLAQLRS